MYKDIFELLDDLDRIQQGTSRCEFTFTKLRFIGKARDLVSQHLLLQPLHSIVNATII